MNRRLVLSVVVVAALSAVAAREGRAQYVTFFAPAPAVVPIPIAAPAPVAAPVVTAFYAPVAQPVYTVAMPATFAAPACAAPAPTVTYFRPPVVGYAPVNRVVTRYRPILGGTVTRVRPGVVPVVW